ncbi:transcriptional regulator [Yersinia pekkanenii]|uniref:transcriptional regulator n=1 Tax=Yersinia pekkanenii TaxID=1288385 RepID=UPI0038B65D78
MGKLLFDTKLEIKMDELRTFLNSLSSGEQAVFARSCGTSIGYLRKALSKNHELGAALSVLIEKNSNSEVTRQHLHPDDWFKIWPELATAA